MFQYFSEEGSVEAVNARIGSNVNPRLKTVMTSLVEHLHAFVKDVHLTQSEWEIAVDFLTRTGQICSGERQEFILLSDALGVSMLVDAINNRRPPGATENTACSVPFMSRMRPNATWATRSRSTARARAACSRAG